MDLATEVYFSFQNFLVHMAADDILREEGKVTKVQHMIVPWVMPSCTLRQDSR